MIVKEQYNTIDMHKVKKRDLNSPQKPVDCLEYLEVSQPRLVIPVGPRFQATVPEWKGPCNDESELSDTSRWLGTRIWPPKDSSMAYDGGKIGKGRSDSCSCAYPGSSECVKLHIAEARKRLRSELGPAFKSWKFDEMGEQVAKWWTAEQQRKFEFFVKMNPVSQDRSFLRPAITSFSPKTRKDIVSYYLNVYLPRRIGMKTKLLGCKVVDSDDEEVDDTVNAKDSTKRSRPIDAASSKAMKHQYLAGRR
ncbi:hypothetical protein Ancab_011526 [Ancistrocladus abbreviatus]